MTDVSIFDMDRTITRRGTYTPWLIFWAAREAPWRLLLLPVSAGFGLAYLAKRIDRGRLKELNHALLMGNDVPRAAVERRAAEFAARIVARGVYRLAIERVAAERAAGRRVVLATASYAFYVRAIADRLGVVDVIATGSVWRGDRLRAELAGENCYGDAKRRMVAAWLAGEPGPHGHVRFFSDHVSDRPTFELADEAIATTPSPALRRLAENRGWQVIDWC